MIRKIATLIVALGLLVSSIPVQAVSFNMGGSDDGLESQEDIQVQSSSVTASGKCGDNLTWTLYDDGLLSIAGAGDMYNYIFNTIPWYTYKDKLKSLSLEYGITSIGSNAFEYCSGFTGNLTIPDSVTSIGIGAFEYCSGFTGNLTIPDSVTSIGDSAFYYCNGLTDINIAKSKGELSNYPWGLAGYYKNKDLVFHWNSPSGVACKINIATPDDVEYNPSGNMTPDPVIKDVI